MVSVPEGKSVREDVFQLIQTFVGQKNLLTIPREFINYTGSIDAALFLSQLLYWTGKGKRADGFIYKTYKAWKDEICLSEYEVRKAVKVLKEKGVLETDVKRADGSPTVHYRLDKDRFSESFLEFLKSRKASNSMNDSVESEESVTETTAEITTETISHPTAPPRGGRGGGGRQDYKKEISTSSGHRVTGFNVHSAEAQGMVDRLRELIPFQDAPAERAAQDRLCRLVDDKVYNEGEILECAKWMLNSLDRVRVMPSTIRQWIPTFIAKKRNGTLQPKRDGYKTKSQQFMETIKDDSMYDELGYDDVPSYVPVDRGKPKTKSERLVEAWSDPIADELLYD